MRFEWRVQGTVYEQGCLRLQKNIYLTEAVLDALVGDSCEVGAEKPRVVGGKEVVGRVRHNFGGYFPAHATVFGWVLI